MSYRDKIKEFTTLLDQISKKIKETESELKEMPLSVRVHFHEVGEDAWLWWNSTTKRIEFENDKKKPLIECKADIRLVSLEALERIKKEAAKLIDEFLKRFEEKRKP